MTALNLNLSATAPQTAGQQHRIHLIGIGGTGMCGLAEILVNIGCIVSGSDRVESEAVRRLQSLGAAIFVGHEAGQVGEAEVVVVSAAIPEDNAEWLEAQQRGLVVISRAEMLANLMRYRKGIAVAGSHGKTTTTSMVATLLATGGLDPTYALGGKLISTSANGALGQGQHLVAEADESDDTFLRLQPEVAVLTNIDTEHMEKFDHDEQQQMAVFGLFLQQLPALGLAVICCDDARAMQLMGQGGHRTVSYGLSEAADFRASGIIAGGGGFHFTLHLAEGATLPVRLNVPGRHNILNMLAAVAVACEEGLQPAAIAEGIAAYRGVSRRMEPIGHRPAGDGKALLISDYGHHPTELQVCLQTLRESWSERRFVLVFQPHRYSRTQSLFGSFVKLLAEVEHLVLLPTYAAGEEPLPGCDSRSMAVAVADMGGRMPVCPANFTEAGEQLQQLLQPDDVVLFQGAGDIGAFATDFAGGGGDSQ